MDTLTAVLAGLAPSVGVGALFVVVMRALIRADRRERAALARLDAEEGADGAGAAAPPGTTPTGGA